MKQYDAMGAMLGLLAMVAGAAPAADELPQAEVYGTLPDGREVRIWTLRNEDGVEARVMEYGATLVSLSTPDQNGQVEDLTHGYDDLAGWLGNTSYFGASVGRFGNRIAAGKFTLDGEDYTLATNNEPGGLPCHLHGGTRGFDKVLWSGQAIAGGVSFSYLSADGEEGYPGALSVTVTYRLNDDNELIWQAEATTTKATPVNLLHHSYWNLSGEATTSINNHLLQLNADRYLPTDKGLIPTGELAPVEDTPMDFREATAIGQRVEADFEALHFGGGYDHAWVLNGDGLRLAARVSEPTSGRTMEILTDQPAIQFYGGNFLDGTVTGKKGVEYGKRSAFCLETERFPDSPNQPDFPDCILRPGETYSHTMIHRFSW
ncbi:aldose epimerase family protein [Roseibacillus ishigakijimensis]|uniref:Aldose 1-epimerase n=1 Tax=Roseibacillus ishigakijimensis TaxID=454146 RepID=A0A934VMS5_9BACT|nr:aldose epimerase family protein [Roseibacillus ishigakijimensis]MBK1834406.1 galactose mutarotase [Roseibacillus ishigakijimensis]